MAHILVVDDDADLRQLLLTALERDGIFLLKGAVRDVAAGLCCSQASVYRYLSQIKNAAPEDSA